VTAGDASTVIEVRVIPRARRNEVGGERDGRLVVRTTAAPVDGRANASVCELVAEHLGVPTRCVEVVSGLRSRNKVLRITRADGSDRAARR
jgi:uncharacterized protein (TIGR00251 family)